MTACTACHPQHNKFACICCRNCGGSCCRLSSASTDGAGCSTCCCTCGCCRGSCSALPCNAVLTLSSNNIKLSTIAFVAVACIASQLASCACTNSRVETAHLAGRRCCHGNCLGVLAGACSRCCRSFRPVGACKMRGSVVLKQYCARPQARCSHVPECPCVRCPGSARTRRNLTHPRPPEQWWRRSLRWRQPRRPLSPGTSRC